MIQLKTLITAIFSWPFRKPPQPETRYDIFLKEEKVAHENAQRIAKEYYTLDESEDYLEITEKVLKSSQTDEKYKQLIRDRGRRFFVFKYPSDEYQVKGLLSFVPGHSNNSLLIFLRGGNRLLSLPDPATDYLCLRNYTIIATSYRGGVSEGNDEYGGSEVNDVNHLMTFFPHLQKKLKLQFNPPKIFMLGASRGGMELFLSLSRFPDLQKMIDKAATLSGLLDMKECIRDRNDMKEMFIKDFGFLPEVNEEEWIKHRDPIQAVENLRKDLPFLIIQGTNDDRVPLKEGDNMEKKLKANGNPVTYLEIPGGTHCLRNHKNRLELIADWFEIN